MASWVNPYSKFGFVCQDSEEKVWRQVQDLRQWLLVTESAIEKCYERWVAEMDSLILARTFIESISISSIANIMADWLL